MRTSLLLLHGALGSSAQWSHIKPTLENDFQVDLLTFGGHGGKPESAYGFGISAFSQELADALTNSGKRWAIGYSMGGYVALRTAMHHPEAFQGIITYGTKFAWDAGSARRETQALDASFLQENAPDFHHHLTEVHGAEHITGLLASTRSMMLELGDGGALTETDLRRVTCPVLILRGSADRMVSEEESRWAASCLPRSQFQSLPDQKHPLEKVSTQLIAEAIRNFVTDPRNQLPA